MNDTALSNRRLIAVGQVAANPVRRICRIPGVFPSAMAPKPHFRIPSYYIFHVTGITQGKFSFFQGTGIFTGNFKNTLIVTTPRFYNMGKQYGQVTLSCPLLRT